MRERRYPSGESTPISYIRIGGKLRAFRCDPQQLWARGREMHVNTYITFGDGSLQTTVQEVPHA